MKNETIFILLVGTLFAIFSCNYRNQIENDNLKTEKVAKNDATTAATIEKRTSLLDSLNLIRIKNLKLNSKIVDTILWWGDRWLITIYYNQDKELVMMDCKNSYSLELGGSNDNYIEWHFFNPDGSYFLYQENIGLDNYITEITQNNGKLSVRIHYPKQNETNQILEDNIRASKISAWNFHNAVYLTFFDDIKYKGFGEVTSTIPNIIVDIDSMMFYKRKGFDSKVLKFLLNGGELSYAGVIEKDSDSNRFWIKVMDLDDNKLGWINCDLSEIKPFTEGH